MPDEKLTPAGLPYRPCVGIVLINPAGLVWIGKREPTKTVDVYQKPWQLPQGGIDPGESPADAALRELWEEVGTRKAEIAEELADWLYYDLPPDVLARKKKRNRWGGQRQKYFGMRFTGEDSDIDLHAHEPEFEDWRWAELEELPEIAVPFKRQVYEEVVRRFAPLIARLRKG